MAVKIDPNDPPSVLRRASALAKASPQQLALAQALARIGNLPSDPEQVARLLKEAISAKSDGEHSWPPIIRLSEAGGYFFTTGSADLAGDFEHKLRDSVVPLLIATAHKYKVDTIEVIGHTDEQAIKPRNSNLDLTLLGALIGSSSISTLTPADNAGLGIARAVSVARVLMSDPRLKNYRILPLSGGQLIDVDERVTRGSQGDIKERRRIEIRLRRSAALTGYSR